MPTIEIKKKYLEKLAGKFDLEILQEIKCNIEKIENDKFFVEVTSDRIDFFSAEGIARAIKLLSGNFLKYGVKASNLAIEVFDVKARPCIVCGLAKNLEFDKDALESLINLQEKLCEIYGRKRENVAIGLHDTKNVEFPLKYKEVRPQQVKFVPLKMTREMNLEEILKRHEKGIKYKNLLEKFEKYPVILDRNNNVLSFPPIINSKLTEIGENTKEVFIDITGKSERYVRNSLGVILSALKDLGGDVFSIKIKKAGKTFDSIGKAKEMELSPKYVNSVLGINLKKREIFELLKKCGFESEILKSGIKVKIPIYRADILGKIDLVEEIAIAYNYNNFEPEIPNVSTIGKENELEHFSDKFREIFLGYGYQEISTPILVSEKLSSLLHKEFFKVKNPVSDKFSCLRTSLLPGILNFLRENTNAKYPQKVFECGDCVKKNLKLPERAENVKIISGAHTGMESNYTNLKGELMGALKSFGIEKCKFEREENELFIKGRCAAIKILGEEIGILGEIHPKVLLEFNLSLPTSAFELNLSVLSSKEGKQPREKTGAFRHVKINSRNIGS